jgi:signal transduction histidine kinase
MQRTPRSLRFYLLSATVYAFLSFFAVQLVYDWELDRAGLHAKGFRPETVFGNTYQVHFVSFAVWLVIALMAGALVHRVQLTLAQSLEATQRRADELAEIADREAKVNQELQRLNQAKSDFVSIVAHEFRTPLTGIQGFSEIIRDYEISLDEAREYASDINNDAKRLTRMINTQLDLDRLQSGRIELAREDIQINKLIASVADLTRAQTKGHKIELDLNPSVPTIQGDPDRLIQVMTNLVSNAINYSPEGTTVRISTFLNDDWVEIRVRDEGIGIPAPALDRIFEPYTRIQTTGENGAAGTGLGLPIVRQIVTLHGGKVWAESAPGKGSVFHVQLPRGQRS